VQPIGKQLSDYLVDCLEQLSPHQLHCIRGTSGSTDLCCDFAQYLKCDTNAVAHGHAEWSAQQAAHSVAVDAADLRPDKPDRAALIAPHVPANRGAVDEADHAADCEANVLSEHAADLDAFQTEWDANDAALNNAHLAPYQAAN
jgi:hypothetical protein